MTAGPAELSEGLVREIGLDPVRLRLGSIDIRPVAVGWATVDLERAATELAPRGTSAEPGLADELLGAAVWHVRGGTGAATAPAGPSLVLLEPIAEGRLAAALARRDEGPAVLYVAPIGRGLRASLGLLAEDGIRTRDGGGPFGPEGLVLGGTAAGPLLVLVAVPSQP